MYRNERRPALSSELIVADSETVVSDSRTNVSYSEGERERERETDFNNQEWSHCVLGQLPQAQSTNAQVQAAKASAVHSNEGGKEPGQPEPQETER